MKIFNIDVSNKQEGFDTLYEHIENSGKFIVCPGHIILIIDGESLCDELKNDTTISCNEITDVEKEIDAPYAKQWVYVNIVKSEISNAKRDIDERVEAMYDILVETNKKIKEGSVRKDGRYKNKQGQQVFKQKKQGFKQKQNKSSKQ